MKLKSLLAGLALAFAGASQAAVVITFDTLPTGSTAAVGAFDALGVRFNQALTIGCGCGDLPSSAPNTALSGGGGDITGYFLGSVTAVDFISVFAGDVGGDVDTVTLNGYDAADQLVSTATFTGESAQTLSISGAGMVRFEILQSGAIAIDDFTFNPAAATVPEPATLALAGLALAGLAASRRRKA